MSAANESSSAHPSVTAVPDWLALVREKVEGLRFGIVQLTVHDGHVTQIERIEKTRLRVAREPRHED